MERLGVYVITVKAGFAIAGMRVVRRVVVLAVYCNVVVVDIL